MIDPKNLRIGNLVNFLGNPVKIKGIYFLDQRPDMYWVKIDGIVDQKIIHIKPISLTEEWILKFGFEKDSEQSYYGRVFIKSNFWVSLDDYQNFGSLFDKNKSLRCFERFCVHQLQNLYFDLKDEELTIKTK